MANYTEEPVLNEHGIQEYVITPIDDYYSVQYTNDRGNDIHSFSLYVSYGERKLINEFNNQMNFLSGRFWRSKVTVLDVYVYHYKKVDYRRNVNGENYISYDLTRHKIDSKLKENIMRYKKGQIVYINTGGDTSTGVIDDQVYSHQGERGELVFTTAPKGYHWEEQDSYRIRFENGTTQYIPSDCISDNVLDFNEVK